MRYLAIDYGTKRVGTAISDKLGIIAGPYQLLENTEKLIDDINNIFKTEQVDAIVLGFPKNMNNTLGPSADNVLKLKVELEALGITVYLQDERRSTSEAKNILITSNLRRSDRKTKIDNMAATIILQTFLDTCKKS